MTGPRGTEETTPPEAAPAADAFAGSRPASGRGSRAAAASAPAEAAAREDAASAGPADGDEKSRASAEGGSPADTSPDADAADAAGAAEEGDEALEAGRLLFAGEWVFTRACHAISHLPASGPVEVAFAGRSNVGKSSLLNALVGQKQLARSSNTPGRTRALNLFARSDGVGPVLVDMPGYGYAKAPKAEVAAWTALVFDYLRGRPNLARVYLLVDSRHGPKPVDLEAMGVMDEAAISYQVVLTKCDKSGSARDAVVKATEQALRRRPAAHPQVLTTSSAKGEGMAELRAAIATLAAERG